ncbi:MAG: cupredoxin domain-containing protein [Roseateles sp.]|uniref:cupredoxin domain-containing protein n=1 Tax=Roseateles sp. TaxID=1971397 RepID=UPI004034F9D0
MKRIATATLLSLAALSGSAWAHGDEKHGKTAAPLKKEQEAWGIAGDAKKVTRTVTLKMTDNMRFTPDRIEVKLGETLRLVVHNDGKMLHELVIGTKKELDEHAALMLKFPNMEHDEPYMTHVDPGKKGEIVWTFNRAGEFDFACLIAGHYQAGMVGKIRVAAR